METALETPVIPDLNEYPIAEAYPIAKAAIEEMASNYLPLVIEQDGTGLKEVHTARMVVKRHRVAVEKKRKELKAPIVKAGKTVDSIAKELFEMMEPIEAHLIREETEYEQEQERIKREAEEARQAALKAKVEELAKYGHITTTYEVDAMTDNVYAATLEEAKQAHAEKLNREAEEEAERDRLEAERKAREEEEAAKRKSEEDRLAAERAAQEAEAAKLRKEREKLEAEKARIEAEKVERLRQEEQDRREKEAAERAAQQERDRIEREQAEAKAKAEREEAERKRQEALRPDREKIEAMAEAVLAVAVPELAADNSPELAMQLRNRLTRCAASIREIADNMK